MINDPARDDELAKKRFVAIQAMRFMGAALVILGLLIINGMIDLPRIVGFVLAGVGIADALIMPLVLTKRWKSPLE
jgi:hypothetical protein